MTKFFLILIALLFSSSMTYGSDVYKSTRNSDWQADIDALQTQLETKHINLYHKISKQEFTRQLEKIKTDLHQWSTPELMVQLMRVVKQVNDGHTQFNYWGSTNHSYPLKLIKLGDQLRVTEIVSTHKHLLGTRLHSINGVSDVQLIEALIPVLQGVENTFSEQQRLVETLTVAEVLEGLRITKPGLKASFTFIDDKQKRYTITLDANNSNSLIGIPQAVPPGFTRHKNSTDALELFINPALETIYLDFKKYPRFQEMHSFAAKLAELTKDQHIKRIIIDLRHNDGGDFFVGLALAWGLIVVDSLDWQKGMYVLIGRQTFSAAMSNAAQYRQILNATLVGEPTGANPVGYQDADTFNLPHSDWKVMYSKRLYKFQDKASDGVQPDINIPLEWNAYKMGEDNQLDWILNKIKADLTPLQKQPL